MSTTARETANAARRAAKDRALFERLVRLSYAGIYNYVRWMSRDRGLAEDLTQETFMRVWEHLPELRNERALKAWVFRVARNEFLQRRRRAGLDTVPLQDSGGAEKADCSSPDPQINLERKSLRESVRAAVDKLPDGYREVIVLHNLEGLSLAEIARLLEIPKGTVKSRRAKALSMLRNLLQEEEAGNHEVR